MGEARDGRRKNKDTQRAQPIKRRRVLGWFGHNATVA
ncbi:hypothetical protein DFP87_12211 [Achromobacter marplatensis]|uniref:Uncharacterized protein n=1 Tax=Achromobacter marplatensis TaxID=470868 RepID=A0ABX9FWF6_9BURK|nr:hypothetical protein DFP87_12211 [Achromobacter marplatensis]CAB3711058.1 hypothetical protein LMG26219_05921 [Achromobacter marplatensis]